MKVLSLTLLLVLLAATTALGQPKDVEIGLFLVDISALDERLEVYTAEFDVIARWQHAELAFTPAPGEEIPRLIVGPAAEAHLDTTWNPELFAVNRAKPATDIRTRLYLHPDGTVVFRVRFQNSLRAQMDFRRFPFDSQILPVIVESLVHDADEVRLIPNPDFTGFDPIFEMPEWTVTDLTTVSEVRNRPQERQDYDRLSFQVHLDRQSGYYLWKIMLPIMVIVMISWIVFWMSEEMLGRRAGISATGMLTVIAYQFVVGGFLPRLPYQTTLDWFMLVSLLVIAATMFVNLLGSRSEPGRRTAIDRSCRVFFPVIYYSAVILVVVIGVNGG